MIFFEEKEDCRLSSMMNLKINEMKQILESCGLIIIKTIL